MIGAGQQLAGDRDGGDLGPAPPGDRGVGGGELRGALGRSAPPGQHPAQPGSPARDVPVPDGQAPGRVSPAQLASLQASGNQVMSRSRRASPAVNWPTPGKVVRTLTRGSALACWRSSAAGPVDLGGQGAGERQAIGHDLPGHRGQLSSASQPYPGPAPATAVCPGASSAVMPVLSGSPPGPPRRAAGGGRRLAGRCLPGRSRPPCGPSRGNPGSAGAITPGHTRSSRSGHRLVGKARWRAAATVGSAAVITPPWMGEDQVVPANGLGPVVAPTN